MDEDGKVVGAGSPTPAPTTTWPPPIARAEALADAQLSRARGGARRRTARRTPPARSPRCGGRCASSSRWRGSTQLAPALRRAGADRARRRRGRRRRRWTALFEADRRRPTRRLRRRWPTTARASSATWWAARILTDAEDAAPQARAVLRAWRSAPTTGPSSRSRTPRRRRRRRAVAPGAERAGSSRVSPESARRSERLGGARQGARSTSRAWWAPATAARGCRSPRSTIRSEILCHGLGAHALFPETRTVLDIGGQDTKAIQVDGDGVVTSFQMNDRCAAGLRPLPRLHRRRDEPRHPRAGAAGAAGHAGGEDQLHLHGVRRASSCARGCRWARSARTSCSGLHRAIVLRAMSLLARSGGVSRRSSPSPAAWRATRRWCSELDDLVGKHYGERTLNIHTDSIYTGALGAALFAQRGEPRHEAR